MKSSLSRQSSIQLHYPQDEKGHQKFMKVHESPSTSLPVIASHEDEAERMELEDSKRNFNLSSFLNGESGSHRSKRIRTSFTLQQTSILQANFENEANPDGQELERIAHAACLNKRVTQVTMSSIYLPSIKEF